MVVTSLRIVRQISEWAMYDFLVGETYFTPQWKTRLLYFSQIEQCWGCAQNISIYFNHNAHIHCLRFEISLKMFKHTERERKRDYTLLCLLGSL